jgi:DNA repair exonuclease SbcCD ATPase subunit
VSVSHPQEADPSVMTLRQAAERTGLSATTLRRYIKAGKLKARLIPGRYGPEYVVDDEALEEARLDGQTNIPPRDTPPPRDEGPTSPPARRERSSPETVSGDMVPGLIYRELLMKHEHLLVQYGMLRVSGQQLYEIRQEAEQKADEARRSADELRRQRERHAREIGELKTKLRRAELEIADRETRIRELEQRLARVEMEQRNASTARAMDAEFARVVPSSDASPGPGSEPPRDH